MSLTDFILQIEKTFQPAQQTISIGENFYRPVFWAAIASLAINHRIAKTSFAIAPKVRGYSSAVGLGKAIFGEDDYQHVRRNNGKHYSSLVRLDSPAGVDEASSTINACLDAMVKNPAAEGMKALRHVVGELHDNVMSHGCATGFSMAQRYKIHKSKKYCIEFAIADSGMGFLQEIQRSGCAPAVQTHEQAIDWCIQKGNTSKQPPRDDWAQALPEDAMFNPHPGEVIRGGMHVNHHQGLGLAHLMDLVEQSLGEVLIASGDTYLHAHSGARAYHRLFPAWQGVLVCIRLSEDQLNAANAREADDPAILELVRRLGGEYGKDD